MEKRILAVFCALAWACSSSGGGKSDTSLPDTPQDTIQDQGGDIVPDEGKDIPPDLPPDPGKDTPPDQAQDTVPDTCTGADKHLDERGFCIRKPMVHDIPIEMSMGGGGGTEKAWDKDHVCTLKYKDLDGFFYIQGTPEKVVFGTVYKTEGAWVSFSGKVDPVPGAVYDGGGNHQNDWAKFTYGNQDIKYYHSSFGFGWRKCQPMDCLQIFAPPGAGPDPTDDGCTKDRTIPVVCVEVKHEGDVPPLDDSFEKCAGDPNT